jgi:hypothetical protein
MFRRPSFHSKDAKDGKDVKDTKAKPTVNTEQAEHDYYYGNNTTTSNPINSPTNNNNNYNNYNVSDANSDIGLGLQGPIDELRDAIRANPQPRDTDYNAVVSITHSEEEYVGSKVVTFYCIDVMMKDPRLKSNSNNNNKNSSNSPGRGAGDDSPTSPHNHNPSGNNSPVVVKEIRKRYSDFVVLRDNINKNNPHIIEPRHFIFPGEY